MVMDQLGYNDIPIAAGSSGWAGQVRPTSQIYLATQPMVSGKAWRVTFGGEGCSYHERWLQNPSWLMNIYIYI